MSKDGPPEVLRNVLQGMADPEGFKQRESVYLEAKKKAEGALLMVRAKLAKEFGLDGR